MSSFPLPTLGPTIGVTGISAPSYSDILTSLQAAFQAIYGSDAVITPDSQDGQMLAIFAAAINDGNQAAIFIYNNFAPTFAQGAALSAYVKINGIARKIASNSSAVLTITGSALATITGGSARDSLNQIWDLPPVVTIPGSGTIDVTATAREAGAVTADAATITQIATPTLGWQSVTNAADATVGDPTETDAQLRKRQTESVSLPALTPLQSILASVAAVPAVQRHAIYDNDTGSTDGDGIPAHSISVVVEGGDILAVATAIERKKSPGTGTYGSTSQVVIDPVGVPVTIDFYELSLKPVYISITVQALTGFVDATKAQIVQALVDFVNSLGIGTDVYYSWLFGPGNLSGTVVGETFKITVLHTGFSASPSGTVDLTIAFNEAASCDAAHVVLVVT